MEVAYGTLDLLITPLPHCKARYIMDYNMEKKVKKVMICIRVPEKAQLRLRQKLIKQKKTVTSWYLEQIVNFLK